MVTTIVRWDFDMSRASPEGVQMHLSESQEPRSAVALVGG